MRLRVSRNDDAQAERWAADVARYRLIFDSIDQGFCTIEVLFDDQGQAVDYVFLQTNRAFVEQTGIETAVGRRMRDLAPGHEDYWFEIYGRIARTGIAERFEAPAGAIGRWYEVYAFRIDAPEEHHVAVLFADIGPRKRSEAALAAAAARDAYLVALADALRPLADPGDLLTRACRVLGEQLGSDRAFYAVVSDDERHWQFEGGHHAAGMAPLVGSYSLDDFGPLLMNEMRRGRTLAVADMAAQPSLGAGEKAAFAALGVGACVGVPLVKGGRWVALLSVHQRVPRHWTGDEIALIEDTAERTWAAVERAKAEAALQASEQRFRLIVEAARDYAIFTCDAGGTIVDWLPGAQAVFGWDRCEVIGESLALTFTPEDRAAGVPACELEGARRNGTAPDRRWHLRRDGRRVFIDGAMTALKDEAGTVLGFVKIGQDVTERHAAEDALRESDQRFRDFANATSDVLWVRNARSMRLEFISPAFADAHGIANVAPPARGGLDRWSELIHPDDRGAVSAAMERVRAGERVTHEFRIVPRGDGEVRWIRSTDFPLVGRAGRIERIGGIGHDISDEKLASNRLEVMVGELQHRTRNLMAVVRSIAGRTARESGTLVEFRERFDGRLESLAMVQNLLSRLTEGRKVTFDELLRAELAAHAAPTERVQLEGPPDVRLRSGSVQTFAMALHELATNSLKYGALAAPSGRLAVRWHVEPGATAAAPRLHVLWTETGALAAPSAASAGGGFGRELIERALPYQLMAQTHYEIGPEGVRCSIVVPVAPAGEEPD